MNRKGALSILCSAVVLTSLAGCGSGHSSTGTTTPPPPPNFELSGKVAGGQQPVIGAEVQLYAAGSGGYGTGATLLAPAAVTDQTGNFTIEGNVTCPSSGALTYITAAGGHTGSATDNSGLGLMAALGTCSSLTSVSSLTINEVTTVAAVWTLAPFLKSGGVVGTSSGNAQGLTNAFANVNSLVDFSSGLAPGKAAPANAKIPTAKIDTLANILTACVQQTTAGACSSLFAAAMPAGGAAPANTLDAALNIARNPATNAAGLFALAATGAPFQPALTAAPSDWTLAISFSGGGLSTPGAVALDAGGNVWVANYFASVSEFSSAGAAISPAGGFTGGGLTESFGLAVNEDGSVWVTNEQSAGSVNGGQGSLTVLNSSGAVISGTGGYVGGGMFFPIAAAVDTDGSVWVADYGDSNASKFSLAGTPTSPAAGFGSAQLEGPVAVAIDANHNAWFANQSAAAGSVTSISSDGTLVNSIACGGDAPSGVATDSIAVSSSAAIGHVWTANYYSDSVSELALHNDGSAAVVSSYVGGGILHPSGIAVDGAGNVWVTNFRGASISELQGANASQPGTLLSPGVGFGTDASLSAPFGVAVDASGNVWVSNQGSIQGASTITQFVGAATPVKTPVLGPPQLP
ncbi:MAG TPA: NHL repeat-containing protein [Acidobacteriaceae bacterium]|jgi:sugar lactone lactonase YvrE|nr:NHL repeat-containing protein [Acidobacteriaceae bacterium]